MDYSLLLGIENLTRNYLMPGGSNRNKYETAIEKGKQQVYHVGIIDYLQKYDLNKFVERHAKAMGRSNYLDNLSAAPSK